MNFEVLKRSHVKRNILIGVIIVLILSAIILTFTRAKYKITKSLPLVNGTINYELSDFNLIGAYIQTEGDNYTQVDEIPTSGYEFNSEKSYCTVNDENINVTLSYDMETQNLTITPLTTKGTKCYLYFDEKLSAGDTILASGNAPTGQTTDWTNNGQGVTYYYTGNPNNWVQFAGFWWRIIRINGDGTIRMIYQGTSANTTGTGTQIGRSIFNSSNRDNKYVGYMYTSGQRQGHDDPSTIKGILDTWYSTYIENEQSNIHYGQYIDGNAGFCGDRRVSSGTGGGTSSTNYQPYTRINNSSPSLSCEKADIYTIDEFEHGNGALTYPIGLISADEAMFAGMPNWNSSGNTNNYLYTGQIYWTMSPSDFDGSYASVFAVYDRGKLGNTSVDWDLPGVRPVINLKSTIAISGSGTTSDPFKVVGAE